MFTDHKMAAEWRTEQRAAGGASARADIFSAGILVTAPGGHGTQFGMPIPTLTSPKDAAAFVDARLAEGSDFIKVVYNPGDGFGISLPSLDEPTLRAVIAAAKARGKVVVVHIGSRAAADTAIAAGASGLVHIFGNEPPPASFGAQTKTAGAFVIPTLSVIESATGTAGGTGLTGVPALAPFLTSVERDALRASFPRRPGSPLRLQHALDATLQLHRAGVAILAGSDAPNPGTVHGATIHRELELLVQAGLSPAAALAAATSAPAQAFGLVGSRANRAGIARRPGPHRRESTGRHHRHTADRGGVEGRRSSRPSARTDRRQHRRGNYSRVDLRLRWSDHHRRVRCRMAGLDRHADGWKVSGRRCNW